MARECEQCKKSNCTMQCPSCAKLGQTTYFCGKECFAKAWPTHKNFHVLIKKMMETSVSDFSDFDFTGPLRPGNVTPMKTVDKDIIAPDYAAATNPQGNPISEQKARNDPIPIHTEETITNMREACKIGRAILNIAGKKAAIGVTTDEIDCVVHEECMKRKVYPSPLNYHRFPKSVCSSVNEVICHGIPDSRPLENGDILNLDITIYHKGVHADMNETFLIGDVDEDSKNLVETAYNCLREAILACKPGMKFRDLGKIIDSVAVKGGCEVNESYCGHGVGPLFHTAPNVPHYKGNRAKGVMKPGMLFTIEPMINAGSHEDDRWPDEWTAVTADGKRSAQFEHSLLITETGVEVLTSPTFDGKMPEYNAEVFQR
eukprot:TRINITY_DN7411_c0_g1_i1.p1 TRINITY_DN7411_c0_g1~~TRINITY_DN7411_c0_g1_i1.p1  ORF type:complete len:373 (+),score=107.41 TRINITY_DN7411_c0_g1_i1:262-1380(+)